MSRRCVTLLSIALLVAGGCTRPEEPKRYELTGQVLAVLPERAELTVRHDDIPGFMPAMTMTYPVVPASLLEGRVAGELVSATLEVTDAQGRLVAIEHRGEAPLPDSANQIAMASGLLEPGDE